MEIISREEFEKVSPEMMAELYSDLSKEYLEIEKENYYLKDKLNEIKVLANENPNTDS